jgi:mannan endo-1,4-beta-mannosidase
MAVSAALLFALAAGAIAAPAGAAKHRKKSARHSIYWGAYMEGPSTYGSSHQDAPWDVGTWEEFQQAARKRVSIIHWGVPPPWEASFDRQLSQHRKILRGGALELLDVNSGSIPLSEIADGKYDSWILDWARQARAFGHPLFLRWDWEMNGRWFHWATMPGQATTADDYVRAWRHMHDLFMSVGARNVSWVWCPNVAFAGSTPFASVYPGAAYVDWTCLDGYNKGGRYSISFAHLFRPSYRALLRLAPNKPMMIGETASVDDSGRKPAWITAALAALPRTFPRIKAFLWFNWNISEDGTTWAWQIESSPAAAAAFARGIASPYFASGSRSRLPKRMTAISPP